MDNKKRENWAIRNYQNDKSQRGKLKLTPSMKRINSTFKVDVLSNYEPTSDKFLTRPIPKSSKFVDTNKDNQLQIVQRLLK
ncbi:hypothetical protein PsorP6_017153 [Peronosclerospora sorghi]|uniref:Uncharacterized protein n=1 Tax=Peronosclerospora sorghi TaxID=230839 RepID=A0ACC0WG79_9STRA|nr:hypothetical protein PsorP6_017153 [Peronosclerospora sorghi]